MVKLLLIKEGVAGMTPHGKWQDQWLDHPFPTMSEPEKAVAYLTDLGDYDEELGSTTRQACIVSIRSSSKCVDDSPYLNDRSIPSPTRAESGMATLHTIQAMLPKSSTSCGLVNNYILTGKDGKTPAERLALGQAPLD